MRADVSAWWGERGDCRPGLEHIARRELGPATELPDLNDPALRGWDGACEHCGASPIPWDAPDVAQHCEAADCDEAPHDYALPAVKLAGGLHPAYDTEDGRLHPGDMLFRAHWAAPEDDPMRCWPAGWTNCDGRHLVGVLPNGHEWDVDSRATNCTLPDDTTHRCWVRDGEPPNVTAGKAGHTCTAGAGSIQSGDYHGFLRDGILT